MRHYIMTFAHMVPKKRWVVLCLTATIAIGAQLAVFSAEMSDEEMAKKLHLEENGSQIIRKNGKRYLLTPFDDAMADRMLKMREMLNTIPKPDPRHKQSQDM